MSVKKFISAVLIGAIIMMTQAAMTQAAMAQATMEAGAAASDIGAAASGIGAATSGIDAVVMSVGSAVSGGIEYINGALGFGLTIPESWAGLYRVEERSDNVAFIDIRNESGGYGGFVFGIYISGDTEPVEWGYKELARSGGKYYYGATPSDVQFVYDNESLRNEYAAMEKDIDAILGSFHLITAGDTTGPAVNPAASPAASPAAGPTASPTVSPAVRPVMSPAARPVTSPAVRPVTSPVASPVTSPAARPATSPATGPAVISATSPAARLAASSIASPTASTVLVDGSIVSFDAYNINDFNYFKLRDLAYVLNGTAKQFEVGWDEAYDSITLTSGKSYTTVGGEMTSKGAGNKNAAPTMSKLYIDGKDAAFIAYNIEGNNYFKLRDIGAAFNFGVDWDDARNTIAIDTKKGYAPEDNSGAQPNATANNSGAQSGANADNSVRTNAGRDYYDELTGCLWHASPVLGSDWASRLALFGDYTFIYSENLMDEDAYVRYITGAWGVSDDGVLTLYYYEALKWEGKFVKETYKPPEKHEILIGNYVYNENEPHQWSVCFETHDSILYGWWWKYENQLDIKDLLMDYAKANT